MMDGWIWGWRRVLEESGRDEGGAWEYFFREGLHQVLLVLMNVEEVAEEEKRSDQILRLWERIFRFVFKLSEEDQQVVYDELRRQGMVESLALVMCHQPHHHPILRRAAFLLSHLHAHDLPRNAPREPDDPPTALRMRDAEGLLDRFRSIEAQPAHFSPDLIAQAHPSSFHARTADAWRMKVKMEGLIPSFMSPMQVRRMREACDGSEASSGSEEAHHNQQGGRSDHGEQRGQEKEAKRDEEAERSRKQESDKQASHHNHRHVDREKVRIAEEVVDQGIHASEKAPLLPTHTRYACTHASYGHHGLIKAMIADMPSIRWSAEMDAAALACSCSGAGSTVWSARAPYLCA